MLLLETVEVLLGVTPVVVWERKWRDMRVSARRE